MAALYITQEAIEAGAKELYESLNSKPWEEADIDEVAKAKESVLKILNAAAEHLQVGPEIPLY